MWRLGGIFEDTRDAGNVVLEILRCDTGSYVQHQNTLHNYDHIDNDNTPVNDGYVVGEYEVIKCDVNNDLGTAPEANTGNFFIVWDAYEDPKNDGTKWSCENIFLVLEHQYEGLSEDPQIMSENYQEILSTCGDGKNCREILDENLG